MRMNIQFFLLFSFTSSKYFLEIFLEIFFLQNLCNLKFSVVQQQIILIIIILWFYCKDKWHVQELSSIYCDILINIELASSNLPKHNKELNYVRIIGWNDIIKSLHKYAINPFLFCHDQGKPRDENSFETIKKHEKN